MANSAEKSITAVIPAFNEEKRICRVIKGTQKHVDEVLVIDDCSSDGTAEVSDRCGAKVIRHSNRNGYLEAVKTGFYNAKGEIIITIDADGENNPEDIPKLIQPIVNGNADLVLGKREKIERISERILNWITNLKFKVADSGTGFRAIKKDLAKKLKLIGKCPCGTFVLEAATYHAKIMEVPIYLIRINKKRKIAWHHFRQLFYILKWLIPLNKNKSKNIEN